MTATRVVLVRPWRDAHGGGGCCGGDVRGGLVFEHRVDGGNRHDHHGDVVGETYRLLRERLPGVDVQITGSDNAAFLVPWSFRAARRRAGARAALRHALRATTAGAVLVDGRVVGDLEALGPQAVLARVRDTLDQAGSGTSSTAATV